MREPTPLVAATGLASRAAAIREKDTSLPSSMYVSRRRRGALLALLLTLLPLALTALPTVGASATSAQGLGGCPAIIHQAGSVSWSAIAWKSCFPGTITQSSPTVTSYRAQTLVAVGDESGAVHLLDAATGRELPGWPVSMAVAGGQHAAIEGSQPPAMTPKKSVAR